MNHSEQENLMSRPKFSKRKLFLFLVSLIVTSICLVLLIDNAGRLGSIKGQYKGEANDANPPQISAMERVTITEDKVFTFNGFSGRIESLENPQTVVHFPAPNFVLEILEVPKNSRGQYVLNLMRTDNDHFRLSGGKIYSTFVRK